MERSTSTSTILLSGALIMLTANLGCADLVGGDMRDVPGISLFGAFARIVRLNHIPSSGFFSGLSLRNQRAVDLSFRLTFGSGRDSVAASMGVNTDASLRFSDWLPFECDESVFEQNWSFRFCPVCLRQGFHSHLHQLPWITQCPWHRCRLRTTCSICNAPLSLTSDSSKPLLVCRNGHDHFDEISTCISVFCPDGTASAFLARYLDWAAEKKLQWKLLPPEAHTTNVQALASVIKLPPIWRECCGTCSANAMVARSRTFTPRPQRPGDVSDAPSSFAKVSALQNKGLGIELPRAYVPGFVKIACDLAEELPPESLTDSEIHLFFDGLERQPDRSFKPAKRLSLSDVKFLPPLLVGERRIVHLSSLSPRATGAIACLIDSLMHKTDPVAGSADEESLRLFLRAAGEILKRAYAEGVRIILSRYVPTLFDSARNRPHLTEPWLLVRTTDRRLAEIQVIWARATHPI